MAIGMQKKVKPSPKKTSEPKQDNQVDGVDVIDTSKSKVDTKYVAIGAGAIVVVLLLFLILTRKPTEPETEVEAPTTEKAETVEAQDDTVAEDVVQDSTQQVEVESNIGVRDLWDDGIYDTPEKVYSASDFISDINGNSVSAIYNVSEKNYITDYVSYVSKRAIVDDGMELYWLEAEYNNKNYRIQIPYQYYVNLGESGICKVNMEVLTLEGGGTIISYMQVINDSEDN